MALLCFDVGNTHTHWGVVEGCAVRAHGELPTAGLDTAALMGLLREHAGTGIALASVVPKVTAVIQPVLLAAGLPFYHLRHDTVRGLGFDYPTPGEVGQDRLADCIGAQLVTGAPAVIVGMGTATTVDILTERGYAGGIIAPGLGVMTQYLHERTALLPALDPAGLLGGPAIGKSTVDAMRAGCALGFAGMIGALLDGVAAELVRQGSAPPQVIVTGGAAVYLPTSWRDRVRHEPHLTLLGLAEAHRRHFA
ncbi:type III pantothenate kinase [Verrucomicrobiota bacterium]|nr:type III pantothenate kinase [Verrucomicrobiota bacterium]GDY17998.1 type III pantothenate kinase [Verrucomicrobiota bacterium]